MASGLIRPGDGPSFRYAGSPVEVLTGADGRPVFGGRDPRPGWVPRTDPARARHLRRGALRHRGTAARRSRRRRSGRGAGGVAVDGAARYPALLQQPVRAAGARPRPLVTRRRRPGVHAGNRRGACPPTGRPTRKSCASSTNSTAAGYCHDRGRPAGHRDRPPAGVCGSVCTRQPRVVGPRRGQLPP